MFLPATQITVNISLKSNWSRPIILSELFDDIRMYFGNTWDAPRHR